jgi:predicted secreted protein
MLFKFNPLEVIMTKIIEITCVEAKAGVPFDIKMRGAASAGYRLTFREPHDSFELVHTETVPDTNRNTIGAFEEVVFTLRGSEVGTFDIWFDLKRPWEDEPAEARPFEVVIG